MTRTCDVQLFTRTGEYVTTVAPPVMPVGVIVWRGRTFAAREGRYVEVEVFQSEENPR